MTMYIVTMYSEAMDEIENPIGTGTTLRCQYGSLTRAEYRAGVRRNICTEPATQYVTRDGRTAPDWYCSNHA